MTKNNKSKKSKGKTNQGRLSKLTLELQAEMIVLLKAGNF